MKFHQNDLETHMRRSTNIQLQPEEILAICQNCYAAGMTSLQIWGLLKQIEQQLHSPSDLIPWQCLRAQLPNWVRTNLN